MRSALVLAALCIALPAAAAGAADSPIPACEATALTGEKVTQAQMLGRPAVLIVTPSKGAAGDTRKWAQALRDAIDPKSIRVRDVLPFFMSESDTLGREKKIPAGYHGQTWLFDGGKLESALGIPTESSTAHVFVLDSRGRVVALASGEPTRQRVDEIARAVREVK